MTLNEWEPRVQNTLKQIVKKDDKVLVLGAHIGTHTLLLSRLVGNSGEVHAFEANPQTFKLLRLNIRINDDTSNIKLYQKAAYSSNSTVQFNAVTIGNTGGSHIVTDQHKKSP